MMDPRGNAAFGLPLIAGLLPVPSRAQVVTEADPASLGRLHDIVVPQAIDPWWPLAPGWYLLAGLITVGTAWGLRRIRRLRRARRYRVEALAELRALRRRAADPRQAAAGLLILLKRTALAAYPRVQVASLSGAAWWGFLDQTGGKPSFADGLGALAEQLAYAHQGGDRLSPADLERLWQAAKHWIKGHRPSDVVPVVHGPAEAGTSAVAPRAGG